MEWNGMERNGTEWNGIYQNKLEYAGLRRNNTGMKRNEQEWYRNIPDRAGIRNEVECLPNKAEYSGMNLKMPKFGLVSTDGFSAVSVSFCCVT